MDLLRYRLVRAAQSGARLLPRDFVRCENLRIVSQRQRQAVGQADR